MKSKKKQLILPQRDEDGNCYISYSQISKWKKSKRSYIRQYFMGEKDDNKLLQDFGDFGHRIGEALENNNFEGFTKEEVVFLDTVPRYDEFETEIHLQLDGVYVYGKIDTHTKPKDYGKGIHVRRMADYKTGIIEKRQPEYESDDYWQTDIYAAYLEQKYGIAPDDVSVILIGRDGNAFNREELTLTGEYVNIKRYITPERLQLVKENVQKVAEEIAEYYAAYLKLNLL